MITKEYLNELFEYREGRIYWKVKTKRPQQKIGDRAGTYVGGGRRYVSVNKIRIGEHRVIYFMHYGITDLLIDHKDGNPDNNLIKNLRPATKAQNEQNTGVRKNNKSGFKGVCFSNSIGKYRATITVNRKQISLGLFKTPEIAHQAYINAANKFHGDFAHY